MGILSSLIKYGAIVKVPSRISRSRPKPKTGQTPQVYPLQPRHHIDNTLTRKVNFPVENMQPPQPETTVPPPLPPEEHTIHPGTTLRDMIRKIREGIP